MVSSTPALKNPSAVTDKLKDTGDVVNTSAKPNVSLPWVFVMGRYISIYTDDIFSPYQTINS